jgi:hypothetical protein
MSQSRDATKIIICLNAAFTVSIHQIVQVVFAAHGVDYTSCSVGMGHRADDFHPLLHIEFTSAKNSLSDAQMLTLAADIITSIGPLAELVSVEKSDVEKLN